MQHPELIKTIARHAHTDGIVTTPIPRLGLYRLSQSMQPIHTVQEPVFCLVAQGAKQVMLGDRMFRYGPDRCFVVSVDVPVVGEVLFATPDQPYLCVRLDLNVELLAETLLHAPNPPAGSRPAPSVMAVGTVTAELVDAVYRMVRLLDTPQDAAYMAPLIEREIYYRLLRTETGDMLRRIARPEPSMEGVVRTIHWLKEKFHEPLRIEDLAEIACLSPSSYHAHFKALTAMSPLQYQKHLRLQEARRKMFTQSMDASSAAIAVGYESASQFSREYRRQFGAPPARDIAQLREGMFAASNDRTHTRM